MSHAGYVVAAYAFAGFAFGAYLLSLSRRRRALQRRLEQLGGWGDHPAEGGKTEG